MSNPIEEILDEVYTMAMKATTREGKQIAALLSQARSDLRAAPALDAARSWRFVIIAIACLMVAAMMGGYIVFVHYQTIQVQEQAQTIIADADNRAQREYYRGVYDSCAAFATNVIGVENQEAIEGCGKILTQTSSDHWHDTESVGFVYPGSAPEMSRP